MLGAVARRLAFVEGRLVEQSALFSDIRPAMAGLEERMDRRFEQVEARLDRLGADQSKHFRWIVGIQVSTLIAVIGALVGAFVVR